MVWYDKKAGFKQRHAAGGVARFRSICEVHREIYDIVDDTQIDLETKEKLFDKIEEAFRMAKRMNAKLVEYKYNITKDEWSTPERKVENRLELRKKRGKRRGR